MALSASLVFNEIGRGILSRSSAIYARVDFKEVGETVLSCRGKVCAPQRTQAHLRCEKKQAGANTFTLPRTWNVQMQTRRFVERPVKCHLTETHWEYVLKVAKRSTDGRKNPENVRNRESQSGWITEKRNLRYLYSTARVWKRSETLGPLPKIFHFPQPD